jgi:hypothetical protein
MLISATGSGTRPVQRCEVGAFEVHDAWVLAQRAEQLTVPDVDRIHARGSGFEQRLREAAGGGAQVDGDTPGGIDLERTQRVRQLHPSPMRLRRAQGERDACADQRRGIGAGQAVDVDVSGGDDRLWIFQMREALRGLGRELAQPRALAAMRPSSRAADERTAAAGGPRARARPRVIYSYLKPVTARMLSRDRGSFRRC